MSLRQSAALVAALSVGLMIALIGGAETASASHYRANQINWHQDTGNTVEFHVTGSWRCTFFFSTSVLGRDRRHIQRGTIRPWGWDFRVPANMTVTSVDVINDVISGEAHLEHTYAGPGPWTASISRLLSTELVQWPHEQRRRHRQVRDDRRSRPDLREPGVARRRRSWTVRSTQLCSFTVPAPTRTVRASAGDSRPPSRRPELRPVQPARWCDDQCHQWPVPVGHDGGSSRTDREARSTRRRSSSRISSGAWSSARSAVDFFIRLGSNSTNAQPVFVAPTPADGSVINGTVGSLMTFDIAATDPDTGDVVTLAMLGQPAGSSFSPTSGNPATGTFSWTPAAAGDYLITLTAADQQGLGAVPRGIILRIALPTATTSVSGDGRFNTGAGRVDFTLSDDTVSLVQSRGAGKFTFNGDVDSITGTGNSATMTGTGTYNGVAGHTFSITVVDNGAPGSEERHDRRRDSQCGGRGRVLDRSPRAPQAREHHRHERNA